MLSAFVAAFAMKARRRLSKARLGSGICIRNCRSYAAIGPATVWIKFTNTGNPIRVANPIKLESTHPLDDQRTS